MHPSPFAVAGMSTTSNAHHGSSNVWGGTSAGGSLTASLGDSLSQSRSHYQPGYMMSAAQGNTSPQGSQRPDDVPIVQTKAKMNHVLTRGSTSDFGMESMFESSRQRQTLADEDAPPTDSINDIPHEIYVESSPARFQARNNTADKLSSLQRQASHTQSQPPQIFYVIVFGYPPDKYSITAEYFKSMGETTDPDQNTEIVNCFRIGYKDAGDAIRAVRKNGEIMSGSWMVGAKWADASPVESLGQPLLHRQASSSDSSNSLPLSNVMLPSAHGRMNSTSSVGTPIRLAPSTSAFRKPGSVEKASIIPSQRTSHGGLATGIAGGQPPTKGMLGQVSDLIFGW